MCGCWSSAIDCRGLFAPSCWRIREPMSSKSRPQGAAIRREIPMGRFGEEGDLDGALLLLVSDAGRFIAGTTIVVDGGQMVALRG